MSYMCLPSPFKPNKPSARKFSEFGKFYEVNWTQAIGKGGFSTVYQGRERASGKLVAVKKIPRKNNSRSRGSSNKVLKQEINAAIKVKEHEFIVSLYDVFVAADVVVLCMEFMEGDVLFKTIVKHGPIVETTAKLHFFNLAKALQHLHSNNIVHRDIKPENLMFSKPVASDSDIQNAKLKITDFGLSKILPDNGRLMQTFCGTPAYLAPESWAAQFKGKQYDSRVDTWSYGVTLFVVISGYHPFDPEAKADIKRLRKNVIEMKWGFDDEGWQSVSTDCKDLIKRLICPVKERLTAAEILEHSWFKEFKDRGFSRKRPIRRTLSQRIKAMQLNSSASGQHAGKKARFQGDKNSELRKKSSGNLSFLRLRLSSRNDSKTKTRQIEIS